MAVGGTVRSVPRCVPEGWEEDYGNDLQLVPLDFYYAATQTGGAVEIIWADADGVTVNGIAAGVSTVTVRNGAGDALESGEFIARDVARVELTPFLREMSRPKGLEIVYSTQDSSRA